MPDPVGEWLADLSGYGTLLWSRAVAPRFGLGIEWRQGDLREATRRQLARLHPHRMELEIVERLEETPSTVTLRLRRLDGPMPPFRPGQYINLFVEISGVRTSRPYSISSAPGLETLDLTVREVPERGFVSTWLCRKAKVGDRLRSTGPRGDFVHEPLFHGRDLLFVAGGSGITPFLSMLRDLERHPKDHRVRLLYGCRRADDVIFESELHRLAERLEGFDWDLILSEPEDGEGSLIDEPTLRRLVDSPERKTCYVCGPGPMITMVDEALAALGVPARRVVHERYGPPVDVTMEPGWPSSVKSSDVFRLTIERMGETKRVEGRAGEPLMNTLERHGIVLPTSCRNGQCSACATLVLEGEAYIPRTVVHRETQRREGFIHACAAYPLSDMVLRLPPVSLKTNSSRKGAP